jgi:hypothetical protein
LLFRIACAIAGALIGGATILGFSSLTSEDKPPSDEALVPETSSSPVEIVGQKPVRASNARLFLAWAAGGVDPSAERALERRRDVAQATMVETGLDWIRRTVGPSGEVLDRPPRGLRIPFERAYIDPAEYAQFVPAADRPAVRALAPGETLLSEGSAELSGGDDGLRIDVGHDRLAVVGSITDFGAAGYEALTAGRAPKSWSRIERYVLVRLERGASRVGIMRTVEPLLDPGVRLRVRSQHETPFLRYADAVLPQLIVKQTFGEFAARALPNGLIEMDTAWREQNIRTETLPPLGEVTCHRLIFPQLRAALADIRNEGLSHTVTNYGGCYSARFINRVPGSRLSHHAWGIALDLNVAENAYSTSPDIDRRLVNRFEEHGFTWGGDWLVPDGMHFEWVKFD